MRYEPVDPQTAQALVDAADPGEARPAPPANLGVGVLVGVVVGAVVGMVAGAVPVGVAVGVGLGALVDWVRYRPPKDEAEEEN